ncbi:hypothetical protein HBH53_187000 [Parastagonospora nodorum]|nr:hypothetical protein HBH53_187000 [Parastagonospora nodorum]KAH3993496.1 hypothetical protein HBI10_202420 [Parastagonospora nodorum]KAH4011711.1 hypothetical protein HBI13_195820 [Parastagonospora nodorum]KAH4945680.1 hypothetical protein HBH73_142000 [Parastagonospora nodorum]KAH4958451.1 hypothetical protein HBI78_181250 [Parastagonospora nodorum]
MFNYLEEDHYALASPAKRTGRHGSGPATRRMLAERALEIDAEEEATGQPPAWQQLYAAERQHFERHYKAADKPDPKLPSIVIKNVLPGSHNNTSTQAALTPSTHRLIIPGFCDTVVEEYSEWQMSRVRRETLRKGVECIHPDYSIKAGVLSGVAKRFVREILHWVEQCKGNGRSDVVLDSGSLEDWDDY